MNDNGYDSDTCSVGSMRGRTLADLKKKAFKLGVKGTTSRTKYTKHTKGKLIDDIVSAMNGRDDVVVETVEEVQTPTPHRERIQIPPPPTPQLHRERIQISPPPTPQLHVQTPIPSSPPPTPQLPNKERVSQRVWKSSKDVVDEVDPPSIHTSMDSGKGRGTHHRHSRKHKDYRHFEHPGYNRYDSDSSDDDDNGSTNEDAEKTENTEKSEDTDTLGTIITLASTILIGAVAVLCAKFGTSSLPPPPPSVVKTPIIPTSSGPPKTTQITHDMLSSDM